MCLGAIMLPCASHVPGYYVHGYHVLGRHVERLDVQGYHVQGCHALVAVCRGCAKPEQHGRGQYELPAGVVSPLQFLTYRAYY